MELKNFSPEQVKERREWLEKKLDINMDSIGKHNLNEKRATQKNIENMIGSTELPLGVAGPVKIKGENVEGEFHVPLATTEGALVASVNRGMKAIRESGGCETAVLQDQMTRGPVFKAKSAKHGKKFVEWVEQNFSKIKKECEKDSRFLELKEINPWIIGKNVFLRFKCFTADAMGMNMVTIGVSNACKHIENNFESVKLVSTSGNMCIDKKPSALNLINGRGKRVIAEVVLDKETVKEVLKTVPEDITEVNKRKNWIGSAQAGSLGFNAHYANIVAALYIATGQDPAHVVSGSMGFTTCEKEGKKLRVSVTLPAVQVGAVGGGTTCSTQKKAMEMMGIKGGGDPPGANSKKLAEIIAASVLAGEISLLAALASKHLSQAHQKLGR